jgi:hypothetical protein
MRSTTTVLIAPSSYSFISYITSASISFLTLSPVSLVLINSLLEVDYGAAKVVPLCKSLDGIAAVFVVAFPNLLTVGVMTGGADLFYFILMLIIPESSGILSLSIAPEPLPNDTLAI